MTRKTLVVLALPVVLGVLGLGGASVYYEAAGGEACARCHEIRPNAETWAASTHRNVACSACHGSALSTNVRMHVQNLNRVLVHWSGRAPEQIRIRQKDIAPMLERCASCHRQEYEDWKSGPHAIRYVDIFANPVHNLRQVPMDDCLRCHGMHFDGGIGDVVTPLDKKGPWSIKDARLAEEPVIPCLSCHAVHREGMPLASRARRAGRTPEQERARPSLGIFDRRSMEDVKLEHLSLPVVLDGVRQVKMSPDQRQALCYQCHAPRAERQALVGDDRTPVGVHEGLSCFACHEKHGMATRASCDNCHPRLSNCGRDVATMDTSFRSPESNHDIHGVACIDCHAAGVPKKRI